jgi:hypothetical protein
VLTVATDDVAVTAGVTVVSGVALTVAAAAVVGAAGVTAVSVGALAVAVGATAVSGVVLTVAPGAVAGADGVTGVSVVVLTVAAGAAGFMAVSAGLLILATGAAAAAAGVLAVSEGVLAVAVDAAAGQCSDVMLRLVTTKLLSVAAELASLAVCPMRVTSWPRCGLRSTLLVAILKVKPVLFSTSVKLGSAPPRQPLMLVFSVSVLGAGVWANPSAINRAGTTIHRNALFMEILRKILALRRSEISLGIFSASDSYVEPSGRSGSGLRTLEHPGETPLPYSQTI